MTVLMPEPRGGGRGRAWVQVCKGEGKLVVE